MYTDYIYETDKETAKKVRRDTVWEVVQRARKTK